MKETWGSTFIMYKSVVILISVGIGISILGFMWVEWADRTGMSGWKWDNGIVAVGMFPFSYLFYLTIFKFVLVIFLIFSFVSVWL